MLGKLICIIANYIILIWLNYKWSEDDIWLKKVEANRILNPVLYYILTPYNGKSKGKRKHKVHEFGLIIVEIVCNLFTVATIIDTLLFKNLLWNMQEWSIYIYIMIVPITGVIYMIIAQVISKLKKKST